MRCSFLVIRTISHASLLSDAAQTRAPSRRYTDGAPRVTTRAFKFLGAGAIGLYSGFEWPVAVAGKPGRWVETAGELRSGVNGIHACRPGDLPYWIDDELWEIELGGKVLEDKRGLLARRGRLLRRVEGWNSETAAAFAAACVERARECARAAKPTSNGDPAQIDAYVQDVSSYASDVPSDIAWAACTAYVEAYLAGVVGSGAGGSVTDAPEFAAARKVQADSLVALLGLRERAESSA
jgi:hypothetical protein